LQKRRLFAVLPALACAALCIFLLVSYAVPLFTHATHLLDADWAGELLLGREMAETGRFFPASWMYSTEIRTLCANVFLAPLYALTGDFLLSGAIATFLWTLVLCAGALFLGRALRLSWAFSFFALALVLFPYGEEYVRMMFYQAFYSPFAATVLFSLALIIRLLSTPKLRRLSLAAVAVLALCHGMMGYRLPLQYYIPLFCAGGALYLLHARALWDRPRLPLPAACLLPLLFSLAGYVINARMLSEAFVFQHPSDVLISSETLDMLDAVLKSLLTFLDFQPGASVFRIASLLSYLKLALAAAVLLSSVLFLRRCLRKASESDVPAAFLAAPLCAFSLLLSFLVALTTTFSFSPRYWIISFLLLPFVFAQFLSALPRPALRGALCAFSFLLCIPSATTRMHTTQALASNAPRAGVIAYLEENGPRQGIAPFWDANTVEVLSDGKLRVLSCRETLDMRPYFWLNTAHLYDIDALADELFCLFPCASVGYLPPDLPLGERLYDDGVYCAYRIDAHTFFDTDLSAAAIRSLDENSVLIDQSPPLLGTQQLHITLEGLTPGEPVTCIREDGAQLILPVSPDGTLSLPLCVRTLKAREAFCVRLEAAQPFSVLRARFDL
jgi:hypothetical protein